jgi:hypothetical protein
MAALRAAAAEKAAARPVSAGAPVAPAAPPAPAGVAAPLPAERLDGKAKLEALKAQAAARKAGAPSGEPSPGE